jgi:hypothetical protein
MKQGFPMYTQVSDMGMGMGMGICWRRTGIVAIKFLFPTFFLRLMVLRSR